MCSRENKSIHKTEVLEEKKNIYLLCALPLPLKDFYTYSATVPDGVDEENAADFYLYRRVSVNFRGRLSWALVIDANFREPDFECKNIEKIIDKNPLVNKVYLDNLRKIADFYLAPFGDLLSMALPAGRMLTKKQLRLLANSKNSNDSGDTDGKAVAAISQKNTETQSFISEGSIRLNTEQKNIFINLRRLLKQSLKQRELSLSLLHGVTGSGKTEIYLHLMKAALEMGHSALLLVPEIGISAQLLARVKEFFGEQADSILEYHSRMKKSDRYFSWHKALRGSDLLAVGTRSSIFLPLEKLALVIIDEEHDSSYKEHSNPRYHVRQVAYMIMQQMGGLMLFGSATPSIESYHLAQKGFMHFFELKERATQHPLPEVKLINLERERITAHKNISNPLLNSMRQSLEEGFQVILLQNRRGYAPLLQCQSCGHTQSCPNCDIPLSYHRGPGEGRLKCHYCGYERHKSEHCPICKSKEVKLLGSAVQKIEEELHELFPAYRIVRLDYDSAQKKSLFGTVDEFRRGNIDILVGTQMIAKGFNFPGVVLVGVVSADIGLNLPDFRSSEKIFSLLTQVSGRSGRGEEKGRVFIQTFQERNPVMQFALRQDYTSFYHHELRIREKLFYPPFARLIRLVFRGREEERVREDAAKCASYLQDLYRNDRQENKTYHLLGPVAAPFARINNNWRYHVLIKEQSLNRGRRLISKMLTEIKVDRLVYRELDIDPVDIL